MVRNYKNTMSLISSFPGYLTIVLTKMTVHFSTLTLMQLEHPLIIATVRLWEVSYDYSISSESNNKNFSFIKRNISFMIPGT